MCKNILGISSGLKFLIVLDVNVFFGWYLGICREKCNNKRSEIIKLNSEIKNKPIFFFVKESVLFSFFYFSCFSLLLKESFLPFNDKSLSDDSLFILSSFVLIYMKF